MESEDSRALQGTRLYSGFQICGTLKPNQKCFRLRRYNQGKYDELFHEHVPKHRISEDNARNFMKTLVARYREWNDFYILQSFLNERGKEPTSERPFQMPIEYPEPGVIRRYCCSGNVEAWMDEVIQPENFRPSGQGHE